MQHTHRELDRVLQDACAKAAQQYGVSPEVHPGDFIFWFIHDDPGLEPKTKAADVYMESGQSTSIILRNILSQHLPSREPFSLLDFASGYGRIARHLSKVLPKADVTACDIHAEAVSFLKRIGVQAVQSATIPEQLDLKRQFDVIFVLSFFTHMPKRTWGRWLKSLANHLAPDGMLIFTTHGLTSQKLMGNPMLESDGFWFKPESEQKDLDAAEYGNTITTFEYVYRHISGTDLRLERFQTPAWGHQDLYVVRRPSVP